MNDKKTYNTRKNPFYPVKEPFEMRREDPPPDGRGKVRVKTKQKFISGFKYCPMCDQQKSLDQFGKRTNGAYKQYCIRCTAERNSQNILVYKYSLLPEQYTALMDKQEGVCAICKKACRTGKRLGVDHDHRCCPGNRSCGKCIRALLCNSCNYIVGVMEAEGLTGHQFQAYIDSFRTDT